MGKQNVPEIRRSFLPGGVVKKTINTVKKNQLCGEEKRKRRQFLIERPSISGEIAHHGEYDPFIHTRYQLHIYKKYI